ncbi:hypothetical protein HanRHA438_Chr15g0716931 [Helianthus annuus]|nr:hypothetical protein HanRHA438_Chr15g0716931 [Helianthus annuus]
MSGCSSNVYRSKARMMKIEPCDIICACGGQTLYKESESKANTGCRYLRCLGGCGFLRWVDVGEEKRCQICHEPQCNPYAIDEIQKDEVVVAPIKEHESYVYFEDQDFEERRPY